MEDHPKFCVIDKDGINLFNIDYVPPIGSTLHYTVEWHMFKGAKGRFSDDYRRHINKIDGKYWTVVDVYGEVRNYDGKEVVVHFVEVKPKHGD